MELWATRSWIRMLPLTAVLEVTLGGHSGGHSDQAWEIRVGSKDPLHARDRECKLWCTHPDFKSLGWSQPKSETEYQWLCKMVTLSPQN